ncbi:MAG: TetR family transcriptional regulator [Pseudonocardiaceae bacterium]|nr:TetR family transcriptional regulator [Pseudonocardiaceae bacterium]
MADEQRSEAGPDGRAVRWAGQRDRRRTEIVDAALAAIALHGPRVSTGQIAAQARIARPQLYRHFSDADELYRAIGDRVAEHVVAELAPVVRRPGRTPRDIIDGAVHGFVEWLARNSQLYRFVTLQENVASAGRINVVGDIKATLTAQIGDLLRGYMAALGVTPTTLAEPLAAGIVGLAESATGQWLANPAGITRDKFANSLAGWIWGILHNALQLHGVHLAADDELPQLQPDQPGPMV